MISRDQSFVNTNKVSLPLYLFDNSHNCAIINNNMITNKSMCKIYLTVLSSEFTDTVLAAFVDIVFVIFVGIVFDTFVNTLSVSFIILSHTITKL